MKDKLFFFLDYQGTAHGGRHFIACDNSTLESGTLPAISATPRATLTGTVSGPNIANLLTGKLGYAVSQGEPYYTPGCGSSSQCVFPGAIIPQSVWSAPAQHLLQYIPAPNIGTNLFSTSADPETVRDDKAGGRMDANTRVGQISGYYFIDNYRLGQSISRRPGRRKHSRL